MSSVRKVELPIGSVMKQVNMCSCYRSVIKQVNQWMLEVFLVLLKTTSILGLPQLVLAAWLSP